MNEREIFIKVLEKADRAERSAFLDDACGTDSELRKQVETLLAAHEKDDSFFLDSPPPGMDATIDQPITEGPGTVIGPYKLLQQIGEGGMGVVYMAEQTEPVERRVAVKIIKPGMDTKQVIARFEAERQALAMMDHPNIAKVLDAGTTESGRPYFVMELVNGISVTQFCDEQHLTARERLELFIPICQAVQHAHQKGVIHRDIKPSNILIALYDSRPVPKVIDFGVAKATSQRLTEKTVFTGLGQIIGTIEYMSPEQAQRNQLDVDTRSDVYSLGVVLYELLSGDTPFDKERLRTAAFDELLRIIREEDPPKPSTRLSTSSTLPAVAANRKAEPAQLSALIRGELDWIVMKALDKDRARRYESASSLAADVEHFLNDDPVAACPPSAGYRFRKFARRNKAAMITAAVVTVSLLLGLFGTTWQAIRATLAEKEATEQATRARQAEEEATAGFSMARNAVDRLMTRVAEEQLLNTPKMEKMRELLLSDALEFYQQMAKLESEDPSLRLDKGVAESLVGRIQGQLNNRDEAEVAHRNAVEQLRALHEEFPERQEYTAALADALHHYGNAILDTSFTDRAADNAALAIETYDEAILLLEDLVKKHPEVSEYKFTLVETYRRRARVAAFTRSRTIEEVTRQLERAESLAAELVRVDSDNPKFRFAYANALSAKDVLPNLESDDRRKSLSESVKLLEDLINDFPEISEYRKLLASTLWQMLNAFPPEQPQDEVKQRQRVVELHEQLATDFPSIAEYRADLSMSRMHLGIALRRNEELQAAEEQYGIAETDILRLREEYPKFTDYTARLAHVYRNVVALHFSQRQYEPADQAAAKLIGLFPNVEGFHYRRAVCLLNMGRYEEALSSLTVALKHSPNHLSSNAVMAWLLVAGPSDMRDPQRAATMAESSLVGLGSERSTILGAAYYRLGQYERAREELTVAVQSADDHPWDYYSDFLFGESLLFLAMTCGQLDKHEEAYNWFAQADTWIEENAGPEDAHLQNLHGETASLLAGLAAKLVVPEDNGPADLDPNRNNVLVAQEPSALEIRLFSSQELSPTDLQSQGVTITRDGRQLQADLDYDLRYDPERKTLAIEPAEGVFEDGLYRVSIPHTLNASETTRSDLAVSVCTQISTPHYLTLQNGRDGYTSATYQLHEPVVFVREGATWRFLDDGSDQDVAWRELDFDDSKWKTGPAQLGYGDDDETTVVEFGPDTQNKYPTTYFRHIFRVTDPGLVRLLRLDLLRDDGAAVYLNGKEVVRDNLSADASFSTYAPVAIDSESESAYLSHDVDSRALLEGENCLAVEVHQQNGESSDISFDLRLTSPPLATIVFEDLFGAGSSHIPAGAVVTSATVRLSASEGLQSDVRLTPVVIDSNDTDTRDDFRATVIDEAGAFDVKHTVQAWCDGSPNRGWILTVADESSSLEGLQHPLELTVNFIAPGDLAPLAWHFANCADAELRDPKLALEYAQRAVRSSPEDANSHTAFGAALYRNGRSDEAVTALKNALEQDSRNQQASIILAMAYAQCGRLENAREILARLPDGHEPAVPLEHELSRLRGEAERLLSAAPSTNSEQ